MLTKIKEKFTDFTNDHLFASGWIITGALCLVLYPVYYGFYWCINKLCEKLYD